MHGRQISPRGRHNTDSSAQAIYVALPGWRVRGNTFAVLPLPLCRPAGLNDVICIEGNSARQGSILVTQPERAA